MGAGEQEAETQSTGNCPQPCCSWPQFPRGGGRRPGSAHWERGKQMTGMPSPELSLCLRPPHLSAPDAQPRLSPLWPSLSGCRPFTHSPSAFVSLHLCSCWVSGLGTPSCPSAHSCPGTRSPSRPRSSKAQLAYSSVCPHLPPPSAWHTLGTMHMSGWEMGFQESPRA